MTLSPQAIGAAIPLAVTAARGAVELIGQASSGFADLVSQGQEAPKAAQSSLQGLLEGIRNQLRDLAGGADFELEVDWSGQSPRVTASGEGAENIQAALANDPNLLGRIKDAAASVIQAYSSAFDPNSLTFASDGWSLNKNDAV